MNHLHAAKAKELLGYALTTEPWHHTVAVNDLRQQMTDCARAKGVLGRNEKRELVYAREAYVKVQVDDRIVMALNGPPEKSPFVFLLVAVPTQALERLESILMPGEPS